MAWDKAYVQVYTGDGKGKTTAALGLAVRAAGAGLRVCIIQFLKGRPTSELKSLARFSGLIAVQRFGRRDFVTGAPSAADLKESRRGLASARSALESGRWDMVILDEANSAVSLGLIRVEELLDLIRASRGRTELVITGRGAHRRIVAEADLVTEMREVKHYFSRGVKARRGVEF